MSTFGSERPSHGRHVIDWEPEPGPSENSGPAVYFQQPGVTSADNGGATPVQNSNIFSRSRTTIGPESGTNRSARPVRIGAYHWRRPSSAGRDATTGIVPARRKRPSSLAPPVGGGFGRMTSRTQPVAVLCNCTKLSVELLSRLVCMYFLIHFTFLRLQFRNTL